MERVLLPSVRVGVFVWRGQERSPPWDYKSSKMSFFFLYNNIYLFIYLAVRIFVAALGIFVAARELLVVACGI